MKLCDYGCGQKATHQFKNGKWCCNNNISKCSMIKNKIGISNKNRVYSKESIENFRKGQTGKFHSEKTKERMSETIKRNGGPWNKGMQGCYSEKTKERMSEGIKRNGGPWNKGKTGVYSVEVLEQMSKSKKGKLFSKEHKQNIGASGKLSIDQINKKYPFFSEIEEMRYNPDKPGEKEIQAHCKNHLCANSKEEGGWFTLTRNQLYERIRQLEKDYGNGGNYFYCSQECKNTCPLYRLRSDPYKNTELPYTSEEIETWRIKVRELDESKCQYCGSTKNIHVHHIIPVKLEPLFALDPVNGICLCEKCHYKIGHKDECSTGKLASKICQEGKLNA